VAVATVRGLSFSYGDGGADGPALADVSLDVAPGEIVLLAGRSGCGKTTLIRALAGLVPHFHGGRFGGSVDIDGCDTRRTRPAELAGKVATLFQDPEDQVVFDGVLSEVSFGIENSGAPSREIERRARAALEDVGAAHLAGRRVAELSGGELQRVCLASTLALEPALLLLDEPTSQLDAEGAVALLELVRRLARARDTAVVISEHRVARTSAFCDRVISLEHGAIVPAGQTGPTLEQGLTPWQTSLTPIVGELVCRLDRVDFSYAAPGHVLSDITLDLRRGEIVALTGANGSGKSTLGKLAAGLLDPDRGARAYVGRAAYLSQDPGRYLARDRCDDEVALGARDGAAATRALGAVGLTGYEARHPRDLSSGERERLALAAVLACEPDLLVLDEPTRGVDLEARARLAALLRSEAPKRATLLITHDHELAAAVANRTVELGAVPAHAAA
jgi:energy-coupling factor transport system ATP-binding protein